MYFGIDKISKFIFSTILKWKAAVLLLQRDTSKTQLPLELDLVWEPLKRTPLHFDNRNA